MYGLECICDEGTSIRWSCFRKKAVDESFCTNPEKADPEHFGLISQNGVTTLRFRELPETEESGWYREMFSSLRDRGLFYCR
jgi:hypothetical protein